MSDSSPDSGPPPAGGGDGARDVGGGSAGGGTGGGDGQRRKWPTDRATLDNEVVWNFFRASGPGGQHRNTADTAVRLFHPPSGTTVTATERRSQHQNRELAMERLIAALKRRNHRPKKRKKTKPTKSSQRRRVEEKKQRGQLKKQRRSLDD